jgi:hypothetical protein
MGYGFPWWAMWMLILTHCVQMEMMVVEKRDLVHGSLWWEGSELIQGYFSRKQTLAEMNNSVTSVVAVCSPAHYVHLNALVMTETYSMENLRTLD